MDENSENTILLARGFDAEMEVTKAGLVLQSLMYLRSWLQP